MNTSTNRTVETERQGIRVSAVDEGDLDRWDDLVARSPMGTVFHRYAALETIATHADATLHPLIGYKGEEPVGVLPVFERRRGPFTIAFSPPPKLGLSQMGPAMVNLEQLKRRRAEKRVKRFLEAALEWIERAVDPSFTHVRTHPRFPDHRPFQWGGFDVRPRYTYVVDLRPGREDVMAEFSSDARRNVRSTPDDAVAIRETGGDGIERIVEHLRTRHVEQGMDFPVSARFASALHDALPDDAFRTYVCTVDGEYVSGMLALADDETVYRWQGGARPARDVDAPVNDLLDWRVMTDAMDRGQERYDLLGANTASLGEYKSKFGPELVSYGSAERGTRIMRFASGLYQRFR